MERQANTTIIDQGTGPSTDVIEKMATPMIWANKMPNSLNEETRTVTFVISDETLDRDGEILKADGCRVDHYNNNPVVLYHHDSGGPGWFGDRKVNPDAVVGYAAVYRDGDQWLADITLEPGDINPDADKVFKKIKFGSLRAVSVGFKHIRGHWGEMDKGEDTGIYYIDDWELLEISVVPIPANPSALVKSYKGEKPQPNQEKETPKEANTTNGPSLIDTRLRLLNIQNF